jgi:hypothetical protein
VPSSGLALKNRSVELGWLSRLGQWNLKAHGYNLQGICGFCPGWPWTCGCGQ